MLMLADPAPHSGHRADDAGQGEDADAQAGSGFYADDVATMLVMLARLRDVPLADVLNPQLLDDLDAVLDEYAAPSVEALPSLTERLNVELGRVLELLPFRVPPREADVVRGWVDRFAGRPLPGDYSSALGQVRRLAVLVQHALDLVEQGGGGAVDV